MINIRINIGKANRGNLKAARIFGIIKTVIAGNHWRVTRPCDRDGDDFCCVVISRQSDCIRGAFTAVKELYTCVIKIVVPSPVCQSERTIRPVFSGIFKSRVMAIIHVADGDCASSGAKLITIFNHCAREGAFDFGIIIVTINRDDDGLLRVVIRRQGDRIRGACSVLKELNFVVIKLVTPSPVCQGERAISAVFSGIFKNRVIAVIHVADGNVACHCPVAVFNHCAREGAFDSRRVIVTRNRDSDRLSNVMIIICCADCEAVGESVTALKTLNSKQIIV